MTAQAILIFVIVAGVAFGLMYSFGMTGNTTPSSPPPVAEESSATQGACSRTSEPQPKPALYVVPPSPPIAVYRPQQPTFVQQAGPIPVDASRLIPWKPQARPFSDRIAEEIKQAIDDLNKLNTRGDPILSQNQSHLSAVLHSAVTRHGHLIERALYNALLDFDRFDVCCPTIPVPDGSGGERNVQVDLVVFDRHENIVRSYEIKRGWSDGLGSHTERQTRANLAAIEGCLIRWGAAQHGWQAQHAQAHVISYYGRTMTQAGGGTTLSCHCLDEHFEVPICARIEEMNAAYKASLQQLLADRGLWEHDTPRHLEAAE